MTISPITQSPNFSEIEALVSSKLTAFELDKEFADAFENLDFERATELVKMGANPNQTVVLSRPLLNKFVTQNRFFYFPQTLFDPLDGKSAEELVLGDENTQDTICEIFEGNSFQPALLLSMLLKEEDFVLLLLEKGADLEFDYAYNILQLATLMNLPEVVKVVLETTTSYSVGETEDTLPEQSPFILATFFGHFDIVNLFLEMCADEVKPMILKMLKDPEEGPWELMSDKGEIVDIKKLFEDHLKQKEMTTGLKV